MNIGERKQLSENKMVNENMQLKRRRLTNETIRVKKEIDERKQSSEKNN